MTYAEWCELVKAEISKRKISHIEAAQLACISLPTLKKILACRGTIQGCNIRSVSQSLGIAGYNQLIEQQRKDRSKAARGSNLRQRLEDALEKHMRLHANCRKCGGSGEIPDETEIDGGTRLCDADRRHVRRNT